MDKKMKIYALLILAFCVSGCKTGQKKTTQRRPEKRQDNQLTDAEKKAGWILLFDGKTTQGWKNYRRNTISKKWVAVDGTLKHLGRGRDIVTEKAFSNFIFQIDWKIGKDTNSGIFYRVTENKSNPWETGPEYQILDNHSKKYKSDAAKATNIAGANYGLYKSIRSATKPLGQWNHTVIVAKGNKIEHWLNGKKVVAYTINSADWKKRIARSKFRAWKDYGLQKKGHFCLQDHGDVVSFKNIKVLELK